MSNNFVHNPTNDEIRLISINSPQVQEENRMSTNNNSPTLFSASNGIIINQSNSVLAVPALFVSPRKVIVNHISPSGSAPKRFSNGESKASYSYRAIATENSATNNTTRAVVISPRIINPGTFTLRTPGGNTSVNRNFETKGEVVCPSCGASGRSLTHCETCKKKFNVNIIQSPRRPASSLLCSKPNSSTISHIGTLTSASMPNGTTKTIIKTMPRLRPSIISGAKSVVPSPINKQLFYGEKTLRQNLDMSPNHPISSAIRTISVKTEPSVLPKQTRVRKQPMKRNLEPECLTLSSDEEESSAKPSSQGSTTDIATSYLNQENINTNSPSKSLDEEAFKNNEAKGLQSAATSSSMEGESSLCLPVTGNSQSDNDSTNPYVPEGIRLMCRSIRIGSYKVQSADPPSLALDISKTCTRFSFPICNTGNEKIFTDVTIPHSDLESIMACFEKRLFVLFLYANQSCGIEVRDKLQMTKETSYFDPSAPDETKKRIIVLPLNISDAEKTFMRQVFTKPKLVDLTQSKANEILVRSTPVGASGSQNACMIRVPSAITRSMSQANVVPKENEAEGAEVVNLCTYPAAPHTGGIAITSEDLLCLKEGEYLNDVIIDFYLKYIYMEKLSKEDQDRTYIFSSFFFNRLVTTPTKSYVKNTTKMSPKEVKHARVKTWTRHVDIFEKDFLIVPVNQSSHWFLVVICFPGKVSSDYIPEPKEKKGASKPSDVLSSASSENEESSSLMSNEAEGNVPDSTTNSNLIPDIENPLPPFIGPLDESMEVDSTNSQNKASVTNETVNRKCEDQTIQSSEVQSTENPESTVCSSKANTELKPIPQPQSGKVPCIIVFDSLPGTSRWRVVANLREYLEVEHQIKKGSTKFYDRVSMKGLNARVARQSNYSDCGVYLLQYAESFFQDPLECFTTPLQDLANWFGPEIINNKREAIKNLILDLAKRK